MHGETRSFIGCGLCMVKNTMTSKKTPKPCCRKKNLVEFKIINTLFYANKEHSYNVILHAYYRVQHLNVCEHSMPITIFSSKPTLTWHIYN